MVDTSCYLLKTKLAQAAAMQWMRKARVDLIKNFTFVLILENTNAQGYVSEKIYDAFIAGCIPIYLGNNNDRVNIPTDMYIDLHKFKTSRDLQAFLDSLSFEDIEAMRQVILDKRHQVLANVSIQALPTPL